MAADENEVGTLVHESATASGSIRIRLDIAYDGTDFRGWTRQPGLRTVQGELEAALATVFSRDGAAPTLTVAGRTDAGVHALGQVAHLDLTPAQAAGFRRARNGGGPGELSRRLNGIAGLDSDIVVTASSLAPEGFDARFSAVWRRYEYRIADSGALRNPLTRRSTLWYPRELDASLMAEAAKSMLGLHDWSSFCKARDGATSVRTLQEFTWSRAADGTLVAHVRADAFCHSMVRALVGATIAVGERRLSLERLLGIRDDRERTSEFKVVPAKGLTLLEVGYPDGEDLAARAEQTRARRDPVVLGG